MKKIVFFCLLLSISFTASSQDKKLALEKVEQYIKSKLNNPKIYSYVLLHEVFEQPDAERIGKELNVTTPIKYSLSLTYKLKDSVVDFQYFHLDRDYNVVGSSTKDDMFKNTPKEIDDILAFMMNEDTGPALDSIETVSTIQLKNKKLKKEITQKEDNFLFRYDRDYFSDKINEFYFSKHVMFPSDSPFLKMGEGVRNYLDTCKSTTIPLEAMLKPFSSEDSSFFINSFINDLRKEQLKKGSLHILDLTSKNELDRIEQHIKTIHFKKFTRTVTSYQTIEGKKTVASFQFDNYSEK
ncbi:MAG TPA: hypothetical protein VFF27_18215 [Bacteroidia bacterium]|jgi:hypothetical protein|nr:hypothetical protein [Bacteroidia bacterium]